MKFTEAQLVEALKAQLSKNGKSIAVSDRTIQAQVKTLYSLGVNEETELADFVGAILPSFEELEGNYRKDNSDFIKKWEKDHPQQNNSPKAEPAKPTGDDKFDVLLKEIQAMKAERDAEKAERATTQKRAELTAKLKEKGVKDDKWVAAYVKKLSLNAETDIDAETTDALELFNKSNANVPPGSTPQPGGGSNDEKPDFSDIVARLRR